MRVNARTLEQIEEPRCPDGLPRPHGRGARLRLARGGAPIGVQPVALSRRRLRERARGLAVPPGSRLRRRGAGRLDRRVRLGVARRGERRRRARAGRDARSAPAARPRSCGEPVRARSGCATRARRWRSSPAAATTRIRSRAGCTSRSAFASSTARWRSAARDPRTSFERGSNVVRTRSRGSEAAGGRDDGGVFDSALDLLSQSPEAYLIVFALALGDGIFPAFPSETGDDHRRAALGRRRAAARLGDRRGRGRCVRGRQPLLRPRPVRRPAGAAAVPRRAPLPRRARMGERPA